MKADEHNNSTASTVLWKFLPWVWLVGAWFAAVAFMWVYGRTYLDGDMASEMVLANLLKIEGGILSVNWFYSTELRVFCEQLLFKIGLFIFPQNWHAARTLAQAALLAMTAGTGLYFFRGINQKNDGIYFTAALMCPFGFWYMFHGTYGGFYLVHIIFVMLSLGLVFRIAAGTLSKHTIIRILLLAFVCFAAGLNGIRLLMNLYVPLVLAATIMLLLRLHKKPMDVKARTMPEVRLMAASLMAAFVSALGYLVNSKFLAAGHHFVRQENRIWGSFHISGLLDSWSNFLSLFGYQVDDYMYEIGGDLAHVPLFGVEGLLNVCGLALAGGIVFSVVRLACRQNTLDFLQRAALVLFLSVLLVDGIAFAWTNSSQSVNASYWLPVVPLAFSLLGLEAETERLRLSQTKKLLAALFCICIIGSSTATTICFLKSPPRANLNLAAVTDWLVENGYTQGYATFWHANTMTEQSNGTLEVWTVGDTTNLVPRAWLQDTSHMTPPQGKIFILLDPGTDPAELAYTEKDGSDVVYTQDGFTVLAYDDAAPIITIAQTDEASAE